MTYLQSHRVEEGTGNSEASRLVVGMGGRLVEMACQAMEGQEGKVAWAFLVRWVLVALLDLSVRRPAKEGQTYVVSFLVGNRAWEMVVGERLADILAFFVQML